MATLWGVVLLGLPPFSSVFLALCLPFFLFLLLGKLLYIYIYHSIAELEALTY